MKMKVCPKCGAQMNDTDTVCAACGMRFESGAPNGGQQTNNWQQGAQQQNNWQQPPYQFDPYDHTTEFDPKDISDNKVIAMLCYLLGTVGVIIALLGSNSSPYAGFHVRQALKFTVLDILLGIIAAVFFWTFLIPIACRHLLCYPVRCPHHLVLLDLPGQGEGAGHRPLVRLPALNFILKQASDCKPVGRLFFMQKEKTAV